MPRTFIKKSTMTKGKTTYPKRKKLEIVREVKPVKLNKVQKSEVKKMMSAQQEHKYFDSYQDAQGQTTTSTIYPLSNIPQGDTVLTRDGDSVMPTSVELRGSWLCGDTTNVNRLLVIRWKERFAVAPPTGLQVYTTDMSVYQPYVPFNKETRDLFEVLYDETFVQTLGACDSNNLGFNIVIPMAKKKIQYYQGSTTDQMNGLYLVCCSDSGLPNHPLLTYWCRVNFTDS